MSATKTKLQLETEIVRLSEIIATQARALRARQNEATMVLLPRPGWEHNCALSHAPYVKPEGLRDNAWVAKVLPVIFQALRSVGVSLDSRAGLWGNSELRFLDHGGGGESIVVPKLVAECLVTLLNAAGDFGNDCYRAGFKDGGDLLKQLASQSITPEDYEDTAAREMALERQNDHRRYRVNNLKV